MWGCDSLLQNWEVNKERILDEEIREAARVGPVMRLLVDWEGAADFSQGCCGI